MTKRVIVSTFTYLILTISSCKVLAQDLVAYYIMGDVCYMVNDQPKPLFLNAKITEPTAVRIPSGGRLELLDDVGHRRICITGPCSGSVILLMGSDNCTTSTVSNEYISYVKSQLADKTFVAGKRNKDITDLPQIGFGGNKQEEKSEDAANTTNSLAARFNLFKKESREIFESFRDKCNREYAEAVRQVWTEVPPTSRVEKPVMPNVKPVIYNGTDRFLFFGKKKHKARTVKVDSRVMEDTIQPQPIEKIEEVPLPDSISPSYMPFNFFGTKMKVRLGEVQRLNVGTITPDRIADILTVLSSKRYDNLLYDCLRLREQYSLCDWAYLQMLQVICNQFCGNNTNEATLLLGYLYYQSGYKVRFASDDVHLYLLVASKHIIYDKSSYLLDDVFFYPIDEISVPIYICKAEFPKEQDLSLYIHSPLDIVSGNYKEREIKSTRYPEICFKVKVDTELIRFYNTYPSSYVGQDFTTRWTMYAETPMNDSIKTQVYPVLRKELEGLTEWDATSRLLNLVQTGLEYEYDDVVWGYDRAFFAEESLYYPFCDCEDRAILFTRLVRDLLGLECILVYYPGHLASAVHFPSLEEVHGDYFTYNDKDYIVCDPTYINAGIGMQMPSLKDSETTLIPIK